VNETPEITEAEATIRELCRKHCEIYITVHETSNIIYTDQTGCFLVVSSQGHKYIMFLCKVDRNYIAFKPMPSKDENEIIRVCNALVDHL
jgi:hypothetical protein